MKVISLINNSVMKNKLDEMKQDQEENLFIEDTFVEGCIDKHSLLWTI